MKKVCVSAILVALSAVAIFANNSNWTGKGRSVSVAWRYSNLNWGAYNPACPENNMYNWTGRGSIVKFNIDGNNVSCDTIHFKKDGLAQYPAFNLEGNMVAFYRWGEGVKHTTHGDSMVNSTAASHISVVNIDGTGLRDLCALPNNPSSECALDWPAGQLIYYVMPKAGNSFNDRNGIEIWSVNVGSGATTKVCTLGSGTNWIRRFSLNLVANRASIQGINYSGNVNYALCFPPTNCDVTACVAGYAGSCNTSLSASGSYVAGYSDSGHGWPELTKIDGTGPAITHLPTRTDVQTWTNKTINGTLITGDGEVIRWAANSDKWICQQYGWYGHADNIAKGTNQIIINWIDSKAIVPSNNPKVPDDASAGGSGVVFYANCPGDFWVDGGQTNFGKYEDGNSGWQSINGFAPTGSYIAVQPVSTIRRSMQSIAGQLAARVDAVGSLSATLFAPGHSIVRVTDLNGRTIYSRSGVSQLSLPAGMLKSGVYLISEQSGNKTESAKISIAR